MQRIRKGDDVIVIAGRDKGKRGTVQKVLPTTHRIYVEDANLVKRHTKPNPARNAPGGIIEKEAAMHISNVALYNAETGRADKVGFKVLNDGRKVRVFRSTGEMVDA
jgi:large subunit ribosomal protein L24